ncbi:MAG: UDP-3-O-acyl-N-acetylglucosamine deacetylase [Thermoanaerobaculia bacterium]|nr:UDP-3-O-acyl-N-acetylglucosamine deacetylase [Thermoanaerobaculia bacterium]
MPKQTVMIVDDEPGIVAALSGVLSDEGFDTVCTGSGREAVDIYRRLKPDCVFLDVWLPDRDGLETLQALRELDPAAAVVMMSGHGTTSTAVTAIKMGAYDYVEKPLSYQEAVEAARGAVEHRHALETDSSLLTSLEKTAERVERRHDLRPPPLFPLVREGSEPQRTIRRSTVIYGLGLHSGGRTGMVIQPLPPDRGIHFVTLPRNTHIPARVDCVAETDYATTLSREGESIRTVEHFLSSLHAYGVTNLLVKVHGELPVLDGSAAEFCNTLEEVGVENQGVPRREVVIDRRYEVGGGDGKRVVLEPFDGFSVSYLLRYPPPIGEQRFEFELSSVEAYRTEVAPARTFGFMRDLKMMSELGLGSGGRLDNCILVGEDNVINTELRFPDEFVRHKVLDVIGDLFLFGYPLRGRVDARLTGHRNNIAILRRVLAAASG